MDSLRFQFLAMGLILAVSTPGYAQLVGWDSGGGLAFAEIDDIDPDTGVPSPPPAYTCFTDPPNVWFGGAEDGSGFVLGFAYVGDTLYGLEFEGGGYYLFTVGVDGFGCAHATRVGGEISAPGFEFNSLAYCPQDDLLYTHAFQPSVPPHRGRLYSINRATGAGTPIGNLTGNDYRITGMTCDPATGVLYGITTGYASRFPNSELVTINRSDSTITSIGITGIPATGSQTNAESLALIVTGSGESLVRRLFAGGAQIWEINLTTGVGTAVGSADSFNGQIFGLAHRSTGGASTGPTATATASGGATATPTATAEETATASLTPTATPTSMEAPSPTQTEVPLNPDELLDLLLGYSTGAIEAPETLWRRSLDWYRQD